MADYVLARKSRNIASSVVHVFLNLLLGVFAVLSTVLVGSPLFGLILVVISKWRIFAVRRRYLWLNIKSNLVDLIVGLSVVMLAYVSGSFAAVHIVLMVIYSVWLIVIKPLSSERATQVQSLIAVFLGISAVMLMSDKFRMDAIFASTMAFIIGYAASRHVLVQTNEQDFTLTTLVCGLVFAEVAWMCNLWMIIYTYFDTQIYIPQAAVILTIFAFLYNLARQAVIKYQEDFRFKMIARPVIFGLVLIAVVVLFTSNPDFNIVKRETTRIEAVNKDRKE